MNDAADPKRNLPIILQQAAKQWNEKLAVVEADRAVTFHELNNQARALAKSFIANGLQIGDRFAIWAPNSIEWQLVAIAGQLVGCVLVPLNTRYKTKEAIDILTRSNCRVIFHVDNFLGVNYSSMLNSAKVEYVIDINMLDDFGSGEKVTESDLDDRINQITPDHIADILYTSGTTGAPKGVMCNHGQNIKVFETWSDGVTLSEADHYLIVNPYFHSFGYKAGWLAALIRGATVYPVQTFDLDNVLSIIAQKRISFLPGAPTIFQSILGHPDRESFDLSSLRCAVTGAASVPVQLVKDMKHTLEFEQVYTAYGLTESTGVVSLCRPGDDFETIATTSGKPMDGIEVQIEKADGTLAFADEPGEIQVRGFNVMQGYLDDPDATAETITEDGWLKTGDIGIFTKAGYLRITDRIKDMFISGGFNCYPAEIENILLNHPLIADVSIIGTQDARMGEVGHAFVVLQEGATIDKPSLITWSREHMANFKVPKQYTFVTTLPRNASGKVQKFLLKSQT